MNAHPIVERVEPGTLSWELYRGDHLQRYHFFASLAKNKVVLDAACGAGYGSNILAESGAQKVYGIDIDKEMILKNKQRYPNPKITFISLPCEEIDKLPEKFDVIVSFETVEHLANPELFLKRPKKCSNPKGFSSAQLLTLYGFAKVQGHLSMYTTSAKWILIHSGHYLRNILIPIRSIISQKV